MEYTYERTLLRNLQELAREKILTDVTFQLGDVNIDCHRNVMAAASPYFRAMFTNAVIERDEKVVKIPNIEPDIFIDLIGYIYTGELKLTNENAQDMLVVGNMFEIPHLIGQCADHMAQELSVSNCVEIFVFATHYSCLDLKEYTKQFIIEHFSEVLSSCENIQDISISDFEEIIASDNLSVDTENLVFDAILKFCQAERNRSYIYNLFKHLRLALINEEYLKFSIENHPYVINDHNCCALLREYGRYVERKVGEHFDSSKYFHINTKFRHGMFNRPMLVFSSGADSFDNRSLTAFDPVSFKNYTGIVPHATFDFKFKISYYQLVTVANSDVYFIGGIFYDNYHLEDSGQALNDVFWYDIKSVRWERKSSMKTRRCCFSTTVINENIFAIGGKPTFPRGTPTTSVEMYNSSSDTWINMTQLPVPLYAHASSATKDAIFVFGGKDDDDDYLDTVFRYDILRDAWFLIATQMPKPRAFPSAFTFKAKLYVVGGISLHENILSVNIYDPDKNKWSFGQDFPEERKITAAGYYDGAIFVCGGVRQMSVIGRRSRQIESRDLYKFDIQSNTWTKVVKLVQYGNTNNISFAFLNVRHLTESEFVSTA
ncbi:kelch-like protein 41a isoform X2 [Dreissena polymorpha]|nr:kelch-like protein 41a isoform X2 [Dreissena polymorpha]